LLNLKDRIIIREKANNSIKAKEYESAISYFKEGLDRNTDYLWYYLFIGDIFYFFIKNIPESIRWYEECIEKGKERLRGDTLSPLRYILKRLTGIYFELEDYKKAVYYYEWFISLKPSNFHDSDFINYAKSLFNLNEQEKANSVLELGLKYSKSTKLRKYYNEVRNEPIDFDEFKTVKDNFIRIPIKTSLIKPGDNIYDLIDQFTKNIRKENDIITIASCVVALSEERIKSVDIIEPTFFAKLLSKFVRSDNFPFGGNAPLCNPMSMQLAIEEVGLLRILFSAVFGGIISKLFKGSGAFYRLAGEQTALIDDMPGAVPPYDYYVILGPLNSNDTSLLIKEKIGLNSAVIDANDLGIAWAVGLSDKSQKKLIEKILSDNPAGNGDQKTPIVILRPVTQ
jgi:tetratricopeptide (TPR) repeat protein